ncbi:MAG: DEAD/DEAH box helicase [Cytophagales bacterium]|nr:MAG: DEAD/DEAH box helicase [Cytophagales bacterium]
MTFHDFNLHDDVLSGVDAMNYQQATPIQEMAIPKIIDGKDLIACAQTGTGKTAAYLIPLLDKISHAEHRHTSTLILVPTRELAKQIDEQVEGFAYFVSATSIALYGGGKGENWDQQRQALTTGADIIIATPGRLMAHMQLGYVKFDKLNYLVLDEADKMLDMGFSDDILKIVREIPKERQTLMFSATMPGRIREFAKKLLTNPDEITLAVSKPAEKIDQQFYLARDHQKLPLLMHLIQQANAQSMVLFTSRKSEVNPIVRALTKLGYEAHGISSDIEQDDRERVLRGFKNKQFPILVATDVLSRGIDIDSLSHVVNYDVPRDAEDYVHRIGRTARAENTGTAITFVNEMDMPRVRKIEKLLDKKIEKRAITEELGLGPAPVEGEGGFRPATGRDGKPRGGDARRGTSGSSGRERGRDSRTGRGGEQRTENRPAAPQVTAQPVESSVVASAGDPTTAAAPSEGSKSRNRNRNRRRGKGPRPEGSSAQATSVPGETNGFAPAENGQPKPEGSKSRNRNRNRGKGRPEGPAVTPTETV